MAKNRYFSHDSNARNSDRLIPLRAELQAEGYAIYFMILERLREEPDYTSVRDYAMLAFDFRVSVESVRRVVEDFDLFAFTEDGERFYSVSFLDRMKAKDAKSEKLRQAAQARWAKNANADTEPRKCNANATPQQKEEKRKSTQKEIKKKEEQNKTKESLSLSPSYEVDAKVEIQELLKEQREKIFSIFFFKNFTKPEAEIESFITHYAANGWRRSGGIAIKTAEQLLACAQQWTQKEKKSRFDVDLLNRYKFFYDAAVGGGRWGQEQLRILLHGLIRLKWADLNQSRIEIRGSRELCELLAPHVEKVAEKMGRNIVIFGNK